MAAAALDEAWIDGLVEASLATEPALADDAVVAFTIGKTKQAVVEITAGRITGAAADAAEPQVSIPMTAAQLDAYCDGSESMSKAFMRGDLKPVGSTGALLPVFALFDDPAFRAALSD